MKAKTMPLEIDRLLQRLDAQETQLAAQSREMERLRAILETADDSREAPARLGRSRRDLLKLAGAAVVGAAGAAALRVVPAAAANGDPITVGGSFTGSGTPTTITSTLGVGFKGVGSAGGDGVDGICTGPNGFGVYGQGDFGFGVIGTVQINGPGRGIGVYGESHNADGIGVEGLGPVAGALGALFQGSRAPINLVPAGAAGPSVTGAHAVGDLWVDSAGILWACITAGTPGACAPLQTGGANLTHFVKVSNAQHRLPNSDGKTWVDMDAVNLSQTITPAFNAQAVISVSADLWTANAGFNQDIGIFVSGGAYGAGTIVAWKESGGFAGTFSPNAASVETTQPLVAGTTYVINVRWKTNQPAAGATIFAGAGPLPPGSAGGGVAGQVSPTRLATHLVVDVPSPSVLRIPANDPSAVPPPPAVLPIKK